MVPTELFEKRELPEEIRRTLEMPCTVSLVDGVVERINFDEEDRAWWDFRYDQSLACYFYRSKNIKRAALNMLQLNLRRNDVLLE